MITARLVPTAGQPTRICLVDELPGGTIRHDITALSVEDARRVGLELVAAAKQASDPAIAQIRLHQQAMSQISASDDAAKRDIESTGGVPPTEGEMS